MRMPVANTGFSSDGMTYKFEVLYSETRPNAKPETVMCHITDDHKNDIKH